ncbi:MAG: CoA pyrophosphatase [Chloroflexi bacterium]|nr:CoA pyrophosphatase [Chloroflexota bacterium]
MSEKIRRILARRDKLAVVSGDAMPAAVLIPLFREGGQVYILFTKRTDTVAHHKGQICFPGGGADPGDSTNLETALRETYEEVGIRGSDVSVLGSLDDLVTSTNFVVSPFVGVIPHPYDFKVCTEEVEEIIEVPLRTLMDEQNFRPEYEGREGSLSPAYFCGKHIIWGVTARLLTQFLELLREGGVSPEAADTLL